MSLRTFELTNCRTLTQDDIEGYADGSDGWWLMLIDETPTGPSVETALVGCYTESESWARVHVICFEDVSGLVPKFCRAESMSVANRFAKDHGGELQMEVTG